MGTHNLPFGYCISSWVLWVCLTGIDDLPLGYCISSWVLWVCLLGTDDLPLGYCISSQVLWICLMSTDDLPLEYCISPQVLWVCLIGTDDLPAYHHRYCRYVSWALINFLLGTAIFLLTGLHIYTGEYKAQGPTLCPTEGRAL